MTEKNALASPSREAHGLPEIRTLAYLARNAALLFKRQAKLQRPTSQLNWLMYRAWDLVDRLDTLAARYENSSGDSRTCDALLDLRPELRSLLEEIERGSASRENLRAQAERLQFAACQVENLPGLLF